VAVDYPKQMLRVSIFTPELGCSDCALTKVCSTRKDSLIDVPMLPERRDAFRVGDEVEVKYSQRANLVAVILLIAIPFVATMGVALAMLVAGCAEWLVAIASLAAMTLTFVAMKRLRVSAAVSLDYRLSSAPPPSED